MGINNNYSDYGSGSSSSSSPWMSQQEIRWSLPAQQNMERPSHKSSSYSDLVSGRCTLEDVMREFQMNGSDSPYNPDEDRLWGKQSGLSVWGAGGMSGGGSGAYRRQMSWPPARAPLPPLQLPTLTPQPLATSTPVFDEAPTAPIPFTLAPAPAPAPLETLSAAQAQVLSSLPVGVLHSLLRQLNAHKRNNAYQECRFCKNNGEHERYYRGHVLKGVGGRVECPVLRAFTCARCGASGDSAHTIKYCPLSTNEERIKSAALMRSVRMASGRRRVNNVAPSLASAADYVVFGEATPSVVQDNNVYSTYVEAPLDPQWAALEQKLML